MKLKHLLLLLAFVVTSAHATFVNPDPWIDNQSAPPIGADWLMFPFDSIDPTIVNG